jgi:hypothetical protein
MKNVKYEKMSQVVTPSGNIANVLSSECHNGKWHNHVRLVDEKILLEYYWSDELEIVKVNE